MKVGLIGLHPISIDMSRSMIENGIEVWGYSSNYDLACEEYEKGYISKKELFAIADIMQNNQYGKYLLSL